MAVQLSAPFVLPRENSTSMECLADVPDMLALGSPLTSLDDDLRVLLAGDPTLTKMVQELLAHREEYVDIDLEQQLASLPWYHDDDGTNNSPSDMTVEEEEEETLAEGCAVSCSVPASPFYSAQASPLSSAPPSPLSFPSSPCSSPPASPQQLEVSLKEPRFYYFSSLPEKSKLIWVVFYATRLYALDSFRLRLESDEESPFELEATKQSWFAYNETFALPYQHKVAFVCPKSTFNRSIFDARLLHSETSFDVALGPFSIVSTTSQRKEEVYKRLIDHCLTDAQKSLIANFRKHSPSKRHHPNGKGSTQASRRGHVFLKKEYERSIAL